MNRVARILAASFVLLCASTGTVAGHFGAESFIFVTDQEIDPGEQFQLIGSDLAPDSTVALALRVDDYSAPLGTLQSGSDGHFETTLTMPSEAPLGYIELVASSPDGTSASAWLHVGARTDQEGPPPAAGQSGFPIDPSLIVLGVILGGSVAAIGYVLLRRTQPSTEPAAEKRIVPRKRSRRRAKPS